MADVGSGDNQKAGDELSVILAFAQMLLDGGDAEKTVIFATDHGWLDIKGQPTVSGNQLAHALLQQSGTRSVFRIW